jgi:hypothetical protein
MNIKVIFIAFILVVFGIYTMLLRREQNRRARPLVGITNDQTMAYPSNAFMNSPNTFKPPRYQDISRYEQK